MACDDGCLCVACVRHEAILAALRACAKALQARALTCPGCEILGCGTKRYPEHAPKCDIGAALALAAPFLEAKKS